MSKAFSLNPKPSLEGSAFHTEVRQEFVTPARGSGVQTSVRLSWTLSEQCFHLFTPAGMREIRNGDLKSPATKGCNVTWTPSHPRELNKSGIVVPAFADNVCMLSWGSLN